MRVFIIRNKNENNYLIGLDENKKPIVTDDRYKAGILTNWIETECLVNYLNSITKCVWESIDISH